MSQEYKCTTSFVIDGYDGLEIPKDYQSRTIPVDSIWALCEQPQISDARLEHEELGWIDIPSEDLKAFFTQI